MSPLDGKKRGTNLHLMQKHLTGRLLSTSAQNSVSSCYFGQYFTLKTFFANHCRINPAVYLLNKCDCQVYDRPCSEKGMKGFLCYVLEVLLTFVKMQKKDRNLGLGHFESYSCF